MMNAENYESITNDIVKALESDNIPWIKPWECVGGFNPINISSGKNYRGINTLILWLAQNRNGFTMNRWLTFKQALDFGGNVRKGEKGTKVIFWKILEKENKKTGEKDKIPLMRVYTVFNIAQCENLPEKITKTVTTEPINWEDSTIESFISNTGANISHGGDVAGYSVTRDMILMPNKNQFENMGGYYSTMFHELTHWTAHNNRCKRPLGERFGTESYAMEELIAELGSAFLCAHFGVNAALQHPAYIKNWIKILKNDKTAIFTAAKHAQEATDFLLRSFIKDEDNNDNEE